MAFDLLKTASDKCSLHLISADSRCFNLTKFVWLLFTKKMTKVKETVFIGFILNTCTISYIISFIIIIFIRMLVLGVFLLLSILYISVYNRAER